MTPLHARLDPGTTTLRVSSDDLDLRGDLRDPRALALSLLDHLTPDDIAEHLRAHPERWAAVHEAVTHDGQRRQIEAAYVAAVQAAGDAQVLALQACEPVDGDWTAYDAAYEQLMNAYKQAVGAAQDERDRALAAL